jgi:hypothetical protein
MASCIASQPMAVPRMMLVGTSFTVMAAGAFGDWRGGLCKTWRADIGREKRSPSTRRAGRAVLVPNHKIEDGINAAHLMFKRVWFDEARCAPGLEALQQHRVDYDEKLRAFKKTANEDWTCDAADSFRYVAMAWKEISQIPAPVAPPLFKPASQCTYLEWSTECGRPQARERA